MADEPVPPGKGAQPFWGPDNKIAGWEYPTQSYGGGGGYGVSSPSDSDKKAGKLLSSIVNENAEIVKDTFAAQLTVYDIADQMSRFMAARKRCQAHRKAGQEWYLEQQKLHSATMQLTDVGANALNSSLFYDFREMVSRADDQADTEILKTLRENLQEIEIALAEALMGTVNSRNDLAANAEQQLRQLFTDWLSQLINLHPDLLSDPEFAPTGNVIINPDDPVPAQANIPGWINYEQWFEDHDLAAIDVEDAPKSRPSAAAQKAWEANELKDIFETEAASDPAYWENVQKLSERKTQ